MDNGEAELLALVQNTAPPACAGVLSVLNNYYGRDHVPQGTYKGSGLSPSSTQLGYVDDLVTSFPSLIKNTSQVADAVDVYRRARSTAPIRGRSLLLTPTPPRRSSLRLHTGA